MAVIGLSGNLLYENTSIPKAFVNRSYVDSVIRSKGVPFLMPITEDEEIIKDCLAEPRMNVAEYKLEETDDNRKRPIRIPKKEADGMLTKNNKYKQCQRMWRYSIKQDQYDN